MSEIVRFQDRVIAADKFAQKIFNQLLDWGFDVAINGTEHIYPDFVNALQESEDLTSLTIRYQPDGVISYGIKPKSAYVEAKKSKYIEKNAYDNYLRLSNSGALVIIVFEINDRVAFCSMQKLKLLPAYHDKFPILDGWIYPRLHQDWLKIKFNGFPGSGTPYREIDQNILTPWVLFSRYIKNYWNAQL